MAAQIVEFLTSAKQLRDRIAYVTAKDAGRRAVIVAYVGDDGSRFLRDPNPEPHIVRQNTQALSAGKAGVDQAPFPAVGARVGKHPELRAVSSLVSFPSSPWRWFLPGKPVTIYRMKRAAQLLNRLPTFAALATVIFGIDVAGSNSGTMTVGSEYLFFGLALGLAPLAQAIGLSAAPVAAQLTVLVLSLFIVLAVIELIAMHVLLRASSKTRWIVRSGALLVFVLVLFFTPRAAPVRMF